MLLVVLIENAFKFVSNYSDKQNRNVLKYLQGVISYTARLNTKELPQAGDSKNSNGIGISNLKRRLELLYNNKYELITHKDDAIYETQLNISLT